MSGPLAPGDLGELDFADPILSESLLNRPLWKVKALTPEVHWAGSLSLGTRCGPRASRWGRR